MKKLFLLVFLVLDSLRGFAAAPVTHAFLAERWLKLHSGYQPETIHSFVRGTLFPDIRYVAKIPREKTHQYGITLGQVGGAKTAFQSGFFFHSFVDEKREKFIKKKNFYPQIQRRFQIPKRQLVTFLKLAEDELLFAKLDRAPISRSLLTVDKEESILHISGDIILQWHGYLLLCINQKPSALMRELAAQKKSYLDIPAETVALWSRLLIEARECAMMQQYANELVAHFDELFEQART